MMYSQPWWAPVSSNFAKGHIMSFLTIVTTRCRHHAMETTYNRRGAQGSQSFGNRLLTSQHQGSSAQQAITRRDQEGGIKCMWLQSNHEAPGTPWFQLCPHFSQWGGHCGWYPCLVDRMNRRCREERWMELFIVSNIWCSLQPNNWYQMLSCDKSCW